MIIEIPENLTFKSALKYFKKIWLINIRRSNESIFSLSNRLEMSRNTIKTILNNDINELSGTKNIYQCMFCHKNKNLQEHHLINRQINKTSWLCKECHILFHRLNNSYDNKDHVNN